MILDISNKDRCVRVEVTNAAGLPKVRMDGVDVAYDWVQLGDGHHSLIIDGRVYDFTLDLTEDTGTVVGREGLEVLHIQDGRRLTSRKGVDAGPSGLQQIKADMPGKVVRILVTEGESVMCDQGLLVLEAMKMQNEIRAPKAGIVRKIGVESGKAVSTGEFLLSLE